MTKKLDHSLTARGVYQCYTQSAIQGCISLLAAQHVNLNLPLVFRNTECHSINVLGRKTFKKNCEENDGDYLNQNRIDEFESRHDNLSPRTSVNVKELQRELSLHEFFDKYSVSWDKEKRHHNDFEINTTYYYGSSKSNKQNIWYVLQKNVSLAEKIPFYPK